MPSMLIPLPPLASPGPPAAEVAGGRTRRCRTACVSPATASSELKQCSAACTHSLYSQPA
eukprot:6504924-Pyramimonas_sp.AAC.1